MFDVLAIGAANTDFFYHVKKLPSLDEEIDAFAIDKSLGGSAANFSVGCAKLNLKTGFLGCLGKDREGKDDDQIVWLRRLLEWQKDVKNPKEFLEFVKIDLFPDEVYVFTPRQEVKAFPRGATPIDFAYAIHTQLGDHCIGAKINGKLAALRQELKNGDIVEVLTSQQQRPSRDWLKFVKTTKARTRISAYIRHAERERALVLGREYLEKGLARLELEPSRYMTERVLLPHAQASGYMSLDSLYIAIGLGKLKVSHILQKVAPKEAARVFAKKTSFTGAIRKLIKGSPEKLAARPTVRIQGMDDILVRFAQCCNPVPGDEILGFISRGRGLIVHTVDCPNALSVGLDSERSVHVEWDIKEKTKHQALLSVETANKPGMLSQVTAAVAEQGSNITEASVKTGDGTRGNIYLTLEVDDLKHLQSMMNSIMRVPGVISVERIKDIRAFKPSRTPGKA